MEWNLKLIGKRPMIAREVQRARVPPIVRVVIFGRMPQEDGKYEVETAGFQNDKAAEYSVKVKDYAPRERLREMAEDGQR